MRQRDDSHRRTTYPALETAPDDISQLHFAQESLDCQLSDQNQHVWLDQREFLFKPRAQLATC